MIQSNLIHHAHLNNIQKILFLGSSCVYPRITSQPIKESSLLDGQLEKTNEPYAVAKIAGIKMCESYNRQFGRDYRSLMPTNLYGPNDNFHHKNSHVIPALIKRFHDAKKQNKSSVVIWGSGKPRREFLHVDDLAEACVHVMNIESKRYTQATNPQSSHINVGVGIDCSIKELAELIQSIVGFEGTLSFDDTMPDGTPKKLLDLELIHGLGWKHQIELKKGISLTYQWCLDNAIWQN